MPVDRPTVIAFYNAARAEIVQRLALREQVVLASLTASGVIAGFALKASGTPEKDPLLLLIPLLTGPFTLAFARHMWLIRHLGVYIAQLRPDLETITVANLPLLDWDAAKVIEKHGPNFFVLELFTFTVLLCGPAAIVLLSVSYRATFYWYGAMSSAVLSLIFMVVQAVWARGKESLASKKKLRLLTALAATAIGAVLLWLGEAWYGLGLCGVALVTFAVFG